jgi:GT2 family glycosyltransferase
MKADIIFPCYNASDVAWRALVQLLLFHSPKDYHIILVDDASSDDTPLLGQWVQRLGGTYIRNETNVGPHEAWNIGCRAAKTDVFIVMNNDILVGPGVLDGLVATADEHGFGCVRELQSPARPAPALFMGKLAPSSTPLLQGYALPSGVSYGSLFAVTRRAWGTGVRSEMRLALADVDFIYRVRDRGYVPMINDGFCVFHLGSQTRIRTFKNDPDAEVSQQQQDFAIFHAFWAHVPEVLAMHSPNPDGESEKVFLRWRNAGGQQ